MRCAEGHCAYELPIKTKRPSKLPGISRFVVPSFSLSPSSYSVTCFQSNNISLFVTLHQLVCMRCSPSATAATTRCIKLVIADRIGLCYQQEAASFIIASSRSEQENTQTRI